MVQQDRYCGGQGHKERAELLLPAAQQGEQLGFTTLASESPVDFHLLDLFCHIRSFPSPHADTCYGYSQCFKSRQRWFWTFLASLMPAVSFPAQGRFSIQLQALCFAETTKYLNRLENLIQKICKVAGIFWYIPEKPSSPFPECKTVALHGAQ